MNESNAWKHRALLSNTRLWLITLAGPIFGLALLETSARAQGMGLGSGPDAPIRVELVDTSTDTITTLVYARAVTVP